MKGLGKVLVGFCIFTSTLLLYVHERVEMLRVSYRIDQKGRLLSQKSEDLSRLTFEVTHLRSPQNLEKRLQELKIPLTRPKEIQVLSIPALPVPSEVKSIGVSQPSHKLFDFLGQWIQVAQARTISERD
ncbi:MAG: hypothetical protein HY447_04925 [Candidatus Omnitrophica bacterium]|nr:hypothetical protein [Candidatus Omnitrophota bacterium]